MFSKILIANRGAIAVRIERTLKKMGIASVAVYAKADRDSLHVEYADEAVFLGEGTAKDTYLNVEKIIEACKKTGAQAVHPGYGFLSENTDFACECEKNGIKFIGPSANQITEFGMKHRAREIAQRAGVPLLSGTGLLSSAEEAAREAEKIGYPVMLKSTAGGGGIGIRICGNKAELLDSFDKVKHLAQSNFNDAGVFLEKYIRHARHIEVQIFGNEFGEVTALGERDCSVQRRNQKVVEESPAPNISDETRQKMYAAAENLAKAASYRNAGTVEFLYDEDAKRFYFLEVNTRLQVEHGISEEVMGIDLVEWMIKEATGELKNLKSLVKKPNGHAIEVRVYAEDCLNNFRPSTGKIDDVAFSPLARTETWIQKNLEITSLYDPMLAKLIVHAENREKALEKMQKVLSDSKLYGVTTNSEYLSALLDSRDYKNASLFTKMLDNFRPEEHAIEVLDGGVQSTVQDCEGMKGLWTVGVPPCGAMDSFSFRLGNKILGNDENAAGLEFTLRGGSYRFRTTTSFCVAGADMTATLDGESVPMYTAVKAMAGQVLKLGNAKCGMRSYLLVAGGIDVSKIFGSSATFADGKFGGHNGRKLRTGDVLKLTKNCVSTEIASFPLEFAPKITNEWTIGVLAGPQPTSEYLKEEFLHTLTTSEYTVNFNSARTGIRLNGAIPEWTREDGGEAGLHPSNIHDNAYAIGALDLTGDQPILLGVDGPSLGGFVCPVTTAQAELWKLGQLHPGDKVRFKLLSLEQAEELRKSLQKNLDFDYTVVSVENLPEAKITADYAILAKGCEDGTDFLIRLQGEENVLVEYGKMELNIELRFRVHILMSELEKQKNALDIIEMTPGIRSLQVHFNVKKMNARKMAQKIGEVNKHLRELDAITVPSRIIHLPLSWDDPQTQLAARRYQETTRPDAPWCPSNPEFIRRINGLESLDDVKKIVFDAKYLVLGLGDVYLGAPVATPIDPRHRLVTTKYNPARPWTPENAVGIGGAYLCVYGMEGPGGYQFVGRTIQMWNSLRETKFFTAGKPWLLDFFDQIQFYPCSADEILQYREDFLRGKFEIQIEETEFSLGDYKKYLASIAESAADFKAKQEAAFEAERNRWREQGLDHFVSDSAESHHEEIAIPEGAESVCATIPGCVWKIVKHEGERVKKGEEIIIMESMKMEFPVIAQNDGIIEKIYAKAGEQVEAGQILAAVS